MESGVKTKGSFWVSFGVWILLISFLSLTPKITGFNLEKGSDKIIHSLFYIPFGIFGFYHPRKGLRTIFLFSLFGVNLGLLFELLQNHIPGRGCEMMDFLADSLGVMIGLIGFSIISRRRQKKKSEESVLPGLSSD